MLSKLDAWVCVCVCVCTAYRIQPHTVYTPVEVISDSLPDTQGRHNLRETQEKRQMCRGEGEMGGRLGRQNQEKKNERKRESVTDRQIDIQTHTQMGR